MSVISKLPQTIIISARCTSERREATLVIFLPVILRDKFKGIIEAMYWEFSAAKSAEKSINHKQASSSYKVSHQEQYSTN